MNILQIVVDVLTSFGPIREDSDRSIVGESPLEESVSRFWHRFGFVLLLAAVAAILYVWVLRPHLATLSK